MPTTEPTFGWRLPTPPDPPDVPKDMANLAEDIADTLQARRIQAGKATVSLSGASTGQVSVNFPFPFKATPVLVATSASTNLNIGFGNLSATSVTLTARTLDGQAVTLSSDVSWIAYGAV